MASQPGPKRHNRVTTPRVYLAGPEVFLPDAAEIGAAKKAICSRHGLIGASPLDDEGPDTSGAIYARCLAMMRGCDAVIANLTPFRSSSADPGTAFELGFMAAFDKPVFGYTNIPGSLRERIQAAGNIRMRDGRLVASDGSTVEDFGLFDNLMLAEALAAHGTPVVTADARPSDEQRDMAAFEKVVALAARVLSERPTPMRQAGSTGADPP